MSGRAVARLDDEPLARLVAEDDDDAFTALYHRYNPALYGYCRSILRHEPDAQDALQSTWSRALAALRARRRDAPLRPWLFRIAHNESISILRRRPRADPSPSPGTLRPSASAEDRVIERERLAELVADLAQLTERSRGALVMRELNGLTHREIATALGTTVAGARQSVYEARRDLFEFAEGRSMACPEVRRAAAGGDRRVLRARRLRAHLRHCPDCASFVAQIASRRDALRGLVPVLPAAAAVSALRRVLGATGNAGGAGVAGGPAASATGIVKALSLAATAKSLIAGGVAASAVAVIATSAVHGPATGTGTRAAAQRTRHEAALPAPPPAPSVRRTPESTVAMEAVLASPGARASTARPAGRTGDASRALRRRDRAAAPLHGGAPGKPTPASQTRHSVRSATQGPPAWSHGTNAAGHGTPTRDRGASGHRGVPARAAAPATRQHESSRAAARRSSAGSSSSAHHGSGSQHARRHVPAAAATTGHRAASRGATRDGSRASGSAGHGAGAGTTATMPSTASPASSAHGSTSATSH